MKRLKVISLLLDYPQQAIWQHQPLLLETCEDLPLLKCALCTVAT